MMDYAGPHDRNRPNPMLHSFPNPRLVSSRPALEDTQPIRIQVRPAKPRRRTFRRGCLSLLLAAIILALAYFLLPFRTNVLILGTDSRESGVVLGRTDTIILTTIQPLRPDVGMLSVPRDLWVPIPGYGENRINTAFFFSEADIPGSGPDKAIETVEVNFGVRMDHYLLVQFSGIVGIVDAFGGIDIDLPRAMSGYQAGTQHMDGTQALAFVRDRSGSDDFFRMERGQLFLKAFLRQSLSPSKWSRLPGTTIAILAALETDVPFFLWPRLGLAMLRAGPDGIDNRAIAREMVTGFTTEGGASVLLPNWDLIRPVVTEVFGRP